MHVDEVKLDFYVISEGRSVKSQSSNGKAVAGHGARRPGTYS